jgi:hypothetical protein
MTKTVFTLLPCAALLAACAGPPLYQPPIDGQAMADVKVHLSFRSAGHHEALLMRGESACLNVPLLRVVQPKIERPGQLIARGMPNATSFDTRLPAGKPVALQFWRQRGPDADVWSFVVLLEAGRSYEAHVDHKSGPSMVDTTTKEEALRLPPNLLKDQLECP